jgi:hypothetical protein
MEWRKKITKTIQNKIQHLKVHFSQKPKLHYKPTCEVGSVREEHIYQSV